MNRLKELRKQNGLTQAEIADIIGVQRKTYRLWEVGNPDGIYTTINSNMLEKLSKIFNVSIDYMLGLSDYTTDYNNLVSEKTGLTNNAINTLIKLNSGKFYNQKRYDYALHTLNLILDNYDNAYLFELIYHYLIGSYNIFGHYDDIGKVVYDGSMTFISDSYKTNKMEIDTKLVNSTILHTIDETLIKWRDNIAKDDKLLLSLKMLPPKDMIEQKIADLYEQVQNKINEYRTFQTEYKKIVNSKKLTIEISEELQDKWLIMYHLKDCIRHQKQEIDDFIFQLEQSYQIEYNRNKEIESEIEKIMDGDDY